MNRVTITFLILALIFVLLFSALLIHGSRCVYVAVENQAVEGLNQYVFNEVCVRYEFADSSQAWELMDPTGKVNRRKPGRVFNGERVEFKILPETLPETMDIRIDITTYWSKDGFSLPITVPIQRGRYSVVTVTGGEEQGYSAEFSRVERINLLTILGIGG